MRVFGVIHQITANLIVFVAETLRTTILGVEQNSRIFNPPGGKDKHGRLNRRVVARTRTHHPARDVLFRVAPFEAKECCIEIEINPRLREYRSKHASKILGLGRSKKCFFLHIGPRQLAVIPVFDFTKPIGSKQLERGKTVILRSLLIVWQELITRNRPASVTQKQPGLEIDRIERARQSCPRGRRAAEYAFTGVVFNAYPFAFDLAQRIPVFGKFELTAFEHTELQARIRQLICQGEASWSRSDDTEVVDRQGSGFDFAEIDNHHLASLLMG